jgi:hypothetical protein
MHMALLSQQYIVMVMDLLFTWEVVIGYYAFPMYHLFHITSVCPF